MDELLVAAMVRRPRGVRIRYIAFRVQPSAGRRDIADAIRAACAELHGPVPVELVAYHGGGGLVRCGHFHKKPVIAALNGIARVGGIAAVVRTVGTSGTIRKARAKYLRSDSENPR